MRKLMFSIASALVLMAVPVVAGESTGAGVFGSYQVQGGSIASTSPFGGVAHASGFSFTNVNRNIDVAASDNQSFFGDGTDTTNVNDNLNITQFGSNSAFGLFGTASSGGGFTGTSTGFGFGFTH